jgi:hypothetical protein
MSPRQAIILPHTYKIQTAHARTRTHTHMHYSSFAFFVFPFQIHVTHCLKSSIRPPQSPVRRPFVRPSGSRRTRKNIKSQHLGARHAGAKMRHGSSPAREALASRGTSGLLLGQPSHNRAKPRFPGTARGLSLSERRARVERYAPNQEGGGAVAVKRRRGVSCRTFLRRTRGRSLDSGQIYLPIGLISRGKAELVIPRGGG